jgi:N utilization substance protein B
VSAAPTSPPADADHADDAAGTAPPSGRDAARSARGGKTVKTPRRRARELAMQGLYQWQITRGEVAAIELQLHEMDGFGKCDREHFDALLHGAIAEAAALDALLARHLDRPAAQLSPIEHAVLWIGAYELRHAIEVPYRVVINEAVELAKTFGGTDGHKYVNGVLDRLAAELRPAEAARRGG